LRRGKSRARLPGQRHFRDGGALGKDRFQQVVVFGRIDAVMTARQHRDGAGRKTGAMGCGVDAARQPRYGAETGLTEVARQPLCEFDAGGRSVARGDDGDQRPRQHRALAAHRQQRRRVVDHLQPRRIIRFAERDEADAAGARRFQLGRGVFARTNAGRPRVVAAAGERGQGVERGTRAAIVIDQVAERARTRYYGANARRLRHNTARTDIVAAGEAQPVEPLLLAQSLPLAHRRPRRAPLSIAQGAASYNRIFQITTGGQSENRCRFLAIKRLSCRSCLRCR
jgi:hypothetical protein